MIQYQHLGHEDYRLKHLFRFMVDPQKPKWWDSHAIEQWLTERWGEPGWDNTSEYRYTHWNPHGNHMTVIIRDDLDAIEFKLRWWNCDTNP